MHFSGWTMIFWRLLCFLLFRLFRLVYMMAQKLYWALNGTLRAVKQSKHPDSYDRCVQVMNVVTYFRTDPAQTIDLTQFLLTHERFESPDYIFDNDHVTLMTINEEVAVFGEALPGQELWRSEYNAFLRHAQLAYCKRLLLVPMSSFHKMSERLGDPTRPLILLAITGRCGSTLVTQMLERTGQCVTVSEPDVMTFLSLWYRERGDTEEMKELSRDCLRWICRPPKSIQPAVYMIKMINIGILAIRFYQSLIPNTRCLFLYRNIETFAKSAYRYAQVVIGLKIALGLGKLHSIFLEMVMKASGRDGKFYKMKLEDDIDFGMMAWMVTCREYIDLRRSGFSIDAIRYEDIIEDKRNATIALLEYCGLPLSMVDLALTALEVDSQRNSLLSRAILGKYSDCVLTKRSRIKFNKMLMENELPKIEDDGVLEGTITHRMY